MRDNKEMTVREKKEVTPATEHTAPGLVFTPLVDILESESAITLIADMPGVAREDMKIDLNEGVLTLSGEVRPWENADESDILVEFDIGKYYRQFAISEAVDQEKIQAQAANGTLRLILPKVEKAKPRKIAVKEAQPN